MVDADKVFVLKDLLGGVADLGEVSTDDERCLGNSPECEVSLLLFFSENTVSNLKHVWVVPVSLLGRASAHLVSEEVSFQTLPHVGRSAINRDILGCPP